MSQTTLVLRSTDEKKRPNPTTLQEGQLAANIGTEEPGLYFADTEGNLRKVGPCHVGPEPPNTGVSTPYFLGLCLGELWYDTVGEILKVWSGSSWLSSDQRLSLASQADEIFSLSDETSSLTVGARLKIPYWPRATVLTSLPVWAVGTPPTGASLQFDIQVNGSSIYAALPTITIGSTNSTATPGAFSTAFSNGGFTLAAGSLVTFSVTRVGSTVAGACLKVVLYTRKIG
jgi:hypothetical protein